jgi:HK97 gp10 family phage protein
MNVKVSLTGQKEIDQVLKNMGKDLTHKVLGAAHATAAKPLIEREKQLAPTGPTSNLVDSIGAVKATAKKATVMGEVNVGPRTKRFKGNHGHLVEFGTKTRRTKNGANRGVMPAHPFAKPAFDQTKLQVEGGISTAIGKVVLRTMKRYIKK